MLNEMRRGSRSLLDNKFFRFLMAGGLAALVNFGSRFLYSLFVDFSLAVVLAFFSGFTVAYLLNRRYVFTDSRNTVPQQVAWFFLVNMLALAQTWGLSVYLAYWLPGHLPGKLAVEQGLVETIAHGAGIILPVFTSYIGHKYLSFRE